MPAALSGHVAPLAPGYRGSSSVARLFEGVKFSVKFGEHLFARDAFATVELCKSFGNFVAQLLAPHLIALLSLFEQQKRRTNDLIYRAIATALHASSDKLLQVWWECNMHETRTPLV
jgi:hypothetical protein